LGNKNISKIFAGGNHSWIVIDDIVPLKENYRPPSPIMELENRRSASNTPLKSTGKFNKDGGANIFNRSNI
jgi:hypothetical protein